VQHSTQSKRRAKRSAIIAEATDSADAKAKHTGSNATGQHCKQPGDKAGQQRDSKRTKQSTLRQSKQEEKVRRHGGAGL
jgi:hypothetical protein